MMSIKIPASFDVGGHAVADEEIVDAILRFRPRARKRMLHQLYMPVSAGCRQRKLPVNPAASSSSSLPRSCRLKPAAPRLGAGVLQVYVLVCDVEIAAEDDRFNGVQLL